METHQNNNVIIVCAIVCWGSDHVLLEEKLPFHVSHVKKNHFTEIKNDFNRVNFIFCLEYVMPFLNSALKDFFKNNRYIQ